MPAVREWLASLGLSEYADSFDENRIDLSILPDLTDQDLKDLGVVLGSPRYRARFPSLLKPLPPRPNW